MLTVDPNVVTFNGPNNMPVFQGTMAYDDVLDVILATNALDGGKTYVLPVTAQAPYGPADISAAFLAGTIFVVLTREPDNENGVPGTLDIKRPATQAEKQADPGIGDQYLASALIPAGHRICVGVAANATHVEVLDQNGGGKTVLWSWVDAQNAVNSLVVHYDGGGVMNSMVFSRI